MKTLMTALCLIGSTLCHCEEVLEYTLRDLDAPQMESFQKGEFRGVLRINEGEVIPFSISIKGDILALSEETHPIFLKALKTLYIKIDGDTFNFSEDQSQWKSFEEQFGGELSLAVGNGDEGPFGTVDLTLKKKS